MLREQELSEGHGAGLGPVQVQEVPGHQNHLNLEVDPGESQCGGGLPAVFRQHEKLGGCQRASTETRV